MKEFEIGISRLRLGTHDFTFKIDDKFFEKFVESPVDKGVTNISLTLEKNERLISLEFKMRGEIELTCDRSLREFTHKFEIEPKLVFKFGEAFEEINEEMYIIPRDESSLDLAQYIYEFICLQVPMKCIHPDIEEDEEDDDEDMSLRYSSEEEEDSTDSTEANDEAIDPRWQDLMKLKNK